MNTLTTLNGQAASACNLDVALRYVRNGLKIFPVDWRPKSATDDSPSKRPLIDHWPEHATADEAMIRAWWSIWPLALVALPTGANGLVVVDADRHGGPDGVDAFERLSDGNGGLPPRTPISRTQSGGRHYVFKQPTRRIGCTRGALPAGIDVRGDGGYVVAPDSALADGRAWTCEPGSFDICDSVMWGTLPEVPEWLAGILAGGRTQAAAVGPTGGAHLPPDVSEKELARLVAGAESTLAAIARMPPKSGRGTKCAELGRVFGPLFTDGILNEAEWRGKIRAAVPDEEDDNAAGHSFPNGIAQSDGSGLAKILARIRRPAALLAEARANGVAVTGFDRVPAAEASDNPFDAPSAADAKRARLAEFGRRTGLTPTNRVERPVDFIGWDSNEAPAPMPTLVEGIVPVVGVTALSGASGAGKTFIAAHLATCLATQRRFFGVDIDERVGTLVVAGERMSQLQGRVQAARKRAGATDALPVAWLKPTIGVDKLEGWEDLAGRLGEAARKMREDFGVRLGCIIIDTIAAAAELKNENDAGEVSAMMRLLGDIAETLGVSVVVVRHHGKDGEKGMRGSTAFRAAFDFHLQAMCQRDPETGEVSNRRIFVEKNTVGVEGQMLGRFDIGSVPMGMDAKGKPWMVGCVEELPTYEPAAGGDAEARERKERETGAKKDRLLSAMGRNPTLSPTTALASHLGFEKSAVSRWLKEMERDRLVKKVNGSWTVTQTGSLHISTVEFKVPAEYFQTAASDAAGMDSPFAVR